MEEVRVAAGATAVVALDVDRYIELDLEHWRQQMNYLREFFWSARLATVGAVRRAAGRGARAARGDRRPARRLARRVPPREGLLH